MTGDGFRNTAWRRLFFALSCLIPLLGSGCAATGPPPGARIEARPPAPPQARTPSADIPASIIGTARSQIGAPYVPSGSSPETGFDCSGFVTWVYDRHGISLPRTSSDQFTVGRSIRSKELREADLVFFQTGKTASSLHVGIYTGDGRFIHSPNPGDTVREESMFLKYWRSRYIGARRVVTRATELDRGLPDRR